MTHQLPYPPPWQDMATLCAHLCVSERTVDKWMKLYKFPTPVERGGGKRFWQWSKVDSWMADNPSMVEELSPAERVRHATREAVNG